MDTKTAWSDAIFALMREERVYADLNKIGGHRVYLTCLGTREDMERHGLTMQEGMALRFWTDDEDLEGNADPFLFEGIVTFDTEYGVWAADLDWKRLRHVSDVCVRAESGHRIIPASEL